MDFLLALTIGLSIGLIAGVAVYFTMDFYEKKGQ